MRARIETAFRQLLYGMNVYSNAWSLSPMGDAELSFDWSYSMIESSQETFNQLISASQTGAVEPAEVRQFIYPSETIDEARERVNEIKEAKKSSDLLIDTSLNEEREA
jgi:threonine dehydrogenase-like Zn-dependent dehydrogenase